MPDSLPFTVEIWSADDQHVEEVLGRLGNILMARAAFTEAVKQYPHRIVRLRNRTMVVEEHLGMRVVKP